MTTETLLALITTISLLAASTALMFAWKINAQWSDFTKKQNRDWAEICSKLNREWDNVYQKVMEEKNNNDDSNEGDCQVKCVFNFYMVA